MLYIESSQSHVNRYCYPHFTDEKTDIQRDYNLTKVRELVGGRVRIWCASRACIPNQTRSPSSPRSQHLLCVKQNAKMIFKNQKKEPRCG